MPPRKPPLVPQVTTLWDYPSQHYGETEQGRSDYRGATPSYVIWNVLHRFSKPGDLVLDPFCGSGTTLDVCRDLDRRGLGFDLQPQRPDIALADARSLPVRARSVDLVFMDPPYADNLDYSDDPRCIGKLAPNGRYQRAMRLVLAESHRVLREDGVLAIYVCDIFRKDRGFFPLGVTLFELARDGFVPLDIVAVTRHNRTLGLGNYRKAADEQNFFLRGFNWLLLFRRRRAGELDAPEAGASPEADPEVRPDPRLTQRAPRPASPRVHRDPRAPDATVAEPRTPRPQAAPVERAPTGPTAPPTAARHRAPLPPTVRTHRVTPQPAPAPAPTEPPSSGGSRRPLSSTRRTGGPARQKAKRR